MSATEPQSSAVPGLQAERTTLAWTRTSFAFLVNGAVLAIKDVHGGTLRLTTVVPASLACGVALCTYLIALRRQRTLGMQPLPARITPRREVHIVGIGALVLVATAVISLLH
ncbi:DUF202 domain-containing protein [Mycobacterium sp.]|uniref:DUF202 domain-containing protein n=1 Tax=Mycobacterium sp. TaxID=1785 RepID=UPI003A88E4A3